MKSPAFVILFFLIIFGMVAIPNHSINLIPNSINYANNSLNTRNPLPTFTPTTEIDINSNSDLIAYPSKTGSGTIQDPYVISGFSITSGDYGVRIGNTTIPLVFHDCYFACELGLFVFNCSNIKIDNCSFNPSINEGILLHSNNNVTVNNCYFYGINTGISSESTINLLVSNNFFNETNSGNSGIYISSGSNVNITGNQMYNFGEFGVSTQTWVNFINNTFGISSGNGFETSGVGSYLYNNTIFNCNYGVEIEEAFGYGGNPANITANIIYGCTTGIYLDHSSVDDVEQNFLYFNHVGLDNEYGYQNTITNNYFCSNDISITYSLEPYYYDYQGYNGNYYSDYQFQVQNAVSSNGITWDVAGNDKNFLGAYTINGNGGSSAGNTILDTSPLVQSPYARTTTITTQYENTTEYPTLNFVVGTENHNITWIARNSYILNGSYWIYLDNQLIQQGIWYSGRIISINAYFSEVGTHVYMARFFDSLGRFQEKIINIDVTETIESQYLNLIWYIVGGSVVGVGLALVVAFYLKTNKCEITDVDILCRMRNKLQY